MGAIVGFAVYGTSLICVFTSSFAMHGLNCGERANAWLRKCDYICIYPLIAGTATPVCLICLRGNYFGWAVNGACWFLAIAGIAMQACADPPMWASMTFYITLGWFGAFLVVPALGCLTLRGVLLFAAGGVAYTAGGAVFVMQRPNPLPGRFGFHEIWHCAVL